MCGLRTSLYFFYENLFSGIVYSIMSNKTLPYHRYNTFDKCLDNSPKRPDTEAAKDQGLSRIAQSN